nr:MAG TPA: hypothetical protein [Caudoviricetes sp.]
MAFNAAKSSFFIFLVFCSIEYPKLDIKGIVFFLSSDFCYF